MGREVGKRSAEEGPLPLTESPLAGATFGNWIRLLRRYGPVGSRPHHRARAAFVTASTLALTPLHLLEGALYDRTIRDVRLEQDPVFILGFFRSGTTHLLRLTGLDPQWGTMDCAQCFAPAAMLAGQGLVRRLVGLCMPETRPHDNVTMSVDDPEEDEHAFSNLTPYGLYHATYFPRHWRTILERWTLFDGVSAEERDAWKRAYHRLLQKATLARDGRRLLLKNPAHMARLPVLLELYPTAKFVFLYRNPYVLYSSLKRFYETEMASGGFQEVEEEALEEQILETYRRMMLRYFDDRRRIPEGNLVELSFEDLERDPLAELGRVYEALGLAGFDRLRPAAAAYLEGLAGYQKNRYRLDEATRRKIEDHWQFTIDRWGYTPPEAT